MTATVGMITFDTADATALAGWWAAALGGTVAQDYGGWYVIVDVPGSPRLGFQKVTEPTPGKNRLHLDIGADDRPAEVARLVGHGATVVAEHAMPGFAWTVLADPDGNQFCVAGPASAGG